MTDFVEAVKSAYKNYANFNGRASRSDYWWVYLFFIIIVFALLFLAGLMGRAGGIISIILIIFYIGSIVPMIALACRRMHDSDKSGWFQLIPFYNLYLAIIKGTDGPNRFGEDPLGGTGDTFS